MKSAHAFTLVELLVVISIIAILSVIGFAVFTNAQKEARDARRVVPMRVVVQAAIKSVLIWKVTEGEQ